MIIDIVNVIDICATVHVLNTSAKGVSSGVSLGASSGASAEAGETVKIPLPAEGASGAEKNKEKPKSGYVTLYEMESES